MDRVIETSSRMLSERRTRTLRDLAARSAKAQTTEEALRIAAQVLADADLDVPFALFYVIDENSHRAQLVATAGVPDGSVLAPAVVELDGAEDDGWPVTAVARSSQSKRIDALGQRFGPFTSGPYPESPKTAIALPLTPPGSEWPAGVVVIGISSRLLLNDAYSAFVDLVAAAVTSALASAGAHEEARKRAEALAEIDRAKTAFFSNVSHEFRTPLTLMLGPLQDELDEVASPLPAARRSRLETAHRNSLRLLKLVNTLLDFSRIEAGRAQALYEPTDLSTLTSHLASAFRSAMEKAGLDFHVHCPPLGEREARVRGSIRLAAGLPAAGIQLGARSVIDAVAVDTEETWRKARMGRLKLYGDAWRPRSQATEPTLGGPRGAARSAELSTADLQPARRLQVRAESARPDEMGSVNGRQIRQPPCGTFVCTPSSSSAHPMGCPCVSPSEAVRARCTACSRPNAQR